MSAVPARRRELIPSGRAMFPAVGVALGVVLACAAAGASPGISPSASSSRGTALAPVPRPIQVVTSRARVLAAARARVRRGDPALQPAYRALLRDARAALAGPLLAVTDKHTLLPPSGNPHDYYSLSPYWWPDPTKPDGLPYVRHDGRTNPASKRDLDQPRVAAMGANVQTLALAYYLSGDTAYGRRAAAQVRHWFLDPATRMTPHLRYAQLVRGVNRERGSGIIDTRWFIDVVDAVGLLQGAPGWSPADQRAMQQWCAQYLQWLRTSPNGAHERRARNNHGSWYAAQTAALALFTGDTVLARRIAADARARIGWQITPDGQQPFELQRTRSLHYSAFNVEALSRLAEIGRHVGVDLWHYQAPSGGSLRRAIDHLARYAPDPARWPGQEITPGLPATLPMILRRAETAYGDTTYRHVLRALPRDLVQTDRSALAYPDPPVVAR